MKLISMTDFVLENTSKRFEDYENKKLLLKIRGYARFLKQPLKLEMFVPCDENGNVLEEPEKYGWLQNVGSMNSYATEQECIDCETFHLAKQKVLFEGFELSTNSEGEKVVVGDYTCLKVSDLENGTIEDLTKYVTIKLTNHAIDRNFGQACY